MWHTRENVKVESPRHLYSLLAKSFQDLSRSLLALSVEMRREREEKRKKGETAQCARGSRDIVSLPRLLHPFTDTSRSHRNLEGSSLFLASRACENSTVQDAIGARRVVEDVQEASYRANYLRLMTLPVRSAKFLISDSQRIPLNNLSKKPYDNLTTTFANHDSHYNNRCIIM